MSTTSKPIARAFQILEKLLYIMIIGVFLSACFCLAVGSGGFVLFLFVCVLQYFFIFFVCVWVIIFVFMCFSVVFCCCFFLFCLQISFTLSYS